MQTHISIIRIYRTTCPLPLRFLFYSSLWTQTSRLQHLSIHFRYSGQPSARTTYKCIAFRPHILYFATRSHIFYNCCTRIPLACNLRLGIPSRLHTNKVSVRCKQWACRQWMQMFSWTLCKPRNLQYGFISGLLSDITPGESGRKKHVLPLAPFGVRLQKKRARKSSRNSDHSTRFMFCCSLRWLRKVWSKIREGIKVGDLFSSMLSLTLLDICFPLCS